VITKPFILGYGGECHMPYPQAMPQVGTGHAINFLGEPIFQNDEFTYRTLTLFGNKKS
jgi:hypothetical protein